MIRNKLTPSWIIVLLLIGIFHAFNLGPVGVSAADYPSVYVDPMSTVDENLTIGFNYTASIMTDYSDGANITGYQFSLTYNPDVLHITSVDNGDLIAPPFVEFSNGSIDNVAGTLTNTGAYFQFSGVGLEVSGPGTLANITFEVMDIGESDITLGNKTQLNGWNVTGGYAYPIVNGLTNR